MEVVSSLPDSSDNPIALAIGKFDGVHLGHKAVIRQLRRFAAERSIPACVMTFEPLPQEFFGWARPLDRLTTLTEKITLLRREGLDRLYVCPFDDRLASLTPRQFVSQILADRLFVRTLLVGRDFRFGAGRAGDFDMLSCLGRTHGMDVHAIETIAIAGERVSSTAIRTARANRDGASVTQLLGNQMFQPLWWLDAC